MLQFYSRDSINNRFIKLKGQRPHIWPNDQRVDLARRRRGAISSLGGTSGRARGGPARRAMAQARGDRLAQPVKPTGAAETRNGPYAFH